MIILSHLWKLLSKFLLICFFSCIASQALAKSFHDCDLNFTVEHPIEECTDLYEKKISSLTATQKQYFEDEFKRIVDDKRTVPVWGIYEELAYLFKDYPTSKVLFTKLQLSEKVSKTYKYDSTQINWDDPVCSDCYYYPFMLKQYKILSSMLEKKGILETKEKNMLLISKQRIECLTDIIDYLSNNLGKSIEQKTIIDKCYN
ncbi:hypothetical protein FcAc13_00185 [Frischella sp. Ac13]|uniref:Uncharacterized protein n=1 Tax=Frischella japonica TaxID=2741544 RepID=A0ABR7QU32_9GAMM|nr:hypothetical protein [Frischella japonica]MBC9129730.1 hypothetical protein [Frischella japonica]